MEESSVKRRARLEAMRTEASSQSQPLSPSIQSLSNPLTSSAGDERTPKAARFDFYTDPMAAFSGSKRRDPSPGGGHYCSPQSFSSPIRSHSPLSYPLNRPSAGSRNSHYAATHPPPGLQFQTNQSPDQSPWRSHPPPGLQFQTDKSTDQSQWRSHPPPGVQFQTNQPPDHCPWRSPIPFQGQFPGNSGGTPPSYTPNRNSWNRSVGAAPGHGFPPNYSARGGGFLSPRFKHGGSPSLHSHSGRGHGWRQFRGSGSSPRSGRSGSGFRHNSCSAGHDPYHFYKAVMKDPWRKLKPIVGSILGPASGSGSWLPKSIASPKKAKVVESGLKQQLSLAESLALSLEEAANDV